MDDKKFDELMKKYVLSTNNSKDKDFRKLNMREKKGDTKSKSLLYKYALVALSCFLVIAVSLAVVLPIYLKDNNLTPDIPDEPSPTEPAPIQYYDNSNIISIPVTSITEINETYQLNIMQPKIENIAETIFVLCSKEDEDKILGIKIELSIYDEFTDNLNMYAILKQYSLDTLANYDNYNMKTTWSNYEVNYLIEYYEEYYYYYIYKMKFGNKDYNYYLEIYRYDEIEVSQLLDLIF